MLLALLDESSICLILALQSKDSNDSLISLKCSEGNFIWFHGRAFPKFLSSFQIPSNLFLPQLSRLPHKRIWSLSLASRTWSQSPTWNATRTRHNKYRTLLKIRTFLLSKSILTNVFSGIFQMNLDRDSFLLENWHISIT